jgi:SH3-like domain-containing protein
MTIDSGYRSPALNVIIGGVASSAHISGYAADFICPTYGTPLEIVKEIASWDGFDFDQIIQEGTWVHISVAPTMRRQVLTATFTDGVASYQKGIKP